MAFQIQSWQSNQLNRILDLIDLIYLIDSIDLNIAPGALWRPLAGQVLPGANVKSSTSIKSIKPITFNIMLLI